MPAGGQPSGLRGRPASLAGIDQVVVLLADGTRADVMDRLLGAGDLPNMARNLVEPSGGRLGEAISVFPSTTGPAHLPFVSGRYPGPCNIPGIRWLDPGVYGRRPWSPFRFRSYMGLGNYLSPWDLGPGVPTLFQAVRDHACAAGNVRRGVRWGRDLTRWAKVWHNVRSFIVQDWFGLDRLVAQRMAAAAARGVRFVFGVLYAADSTGHKQGAESELTLRCYREVDRALGTITDRLREAGKLDRTLLALVSDHGLSDTHTHLDLHALVDSVAPPCLAHPTIWRGLYGAGSAVMVSGNSMAHIYLRPPAGWTAPRPHLDAPDPTLQRLLDALLSEDAVDLVAGRSSSGGMLVLARRGKVHLRAAGEGRVEVSDASGDLLGPDAKLVGTHSDAELLSLTASGAYPDGPRQLLQLLESSRTGDLVVSAAPGFDLRSRFERPAHVGSHGSLHRLHMTTPFLLNRPWGSGPLRTVDVYATVRAALGLERDPGSPGRVLAPAG